MREPCDIVELTKVTEEVQPRHSAVRFLIIARNMDGRIMVSKGSGGYQDHGIACLKAPVALTRYIAYKDGKYFIPNDEVGLFVHRPVSLLERPDRFPARIRSFGPSAPYVTLDLQR